MYVWHIYSQNWVFFVDGKCDHVKHTDPMGYAQLHFDWWNSTYITYQPFIAACQVYGNIFLSDIKNKNKGQKQVPSSLPRIHQLSIEVAII